ncbi:hypothetical protein ACRASX_02620 [Flavobacterium sp. TMP13]|uniref:hypothetical protein n=1 Tax=unclassified Flavobacterium TaxID=196869 RepID=UPI00076CB94A|nr:hypothetical protein [Flavobacterium sp. TAB 87]KVV14456.1 hypothetical protein AP058_02351 [Flavobacterium sp. TAB 87]
MKKVFLSLAAVAVLTVVSCKKADAAAETPAEEVIDSAAMTIDSANQVIDSATQVIDSAATAVEDATK